MVRVVGPRTEETVRLSCVVFEDLVTIRTAAWRPLDRPFARGGSILGEGVGPTVE